MRSDFMAGTALQSSSAAPKPSAKKFQVSAIFKKAQKQVKGAQESAKAKLPGSATQVVKKGQKEAKKAAPSGPSAKKAQQAPKQAANKISSVFGRGSPKKAQQAPKQAASKANSLFGGAKKQANKQANKAGSTFVGAKKQASKASKKAGSAPSGKGWFGEERASGLDKWYGPSRALFLPRGLLDEAEIPGYLNGQLAGDYGYDPLSLGKDQETVEKYRAYELLHARWAMLAAAGIVIPEGLQANGADIYGGTWFETGAEMLNGGTLNYFAVPWGVINNPLPLAAVTGIEVVLMGAVERFRQQGKGPKGYSPGVGKFDSDIFDRLDNLYPGGPFDPLGLADDPEAFAELKVKEIKNGRLGMVAVLAFAIQSYVTGEGPYANWAKHVADPFGYNLLTIIGNEDRLPTL